MTNPLATRVAAFALAVCAIAAPAAAEEVADFYKGKTVRIICGYGEGGGYDLYSRFAAEHLRRHIPGNPSVIVQNMPGAATKRAAKYIYSVAPKDGTVMGMVVQTLPHDTTLGDPEADYDVRRFPWIGRLAANVDIAISWHTGKTRTVEDATKRETIVGATGAIGPSVQVPRVLNAVIGTKFKIVTGYKGSADMALAMERGEIDVVGAISWAGIKATRPQWIRDKQINVLYQTTLERDPDLKDVPAIPDLARNDADRAVLRFLGSSADMGRSLLAPPDTDPARLAALRQAFDAMVRDPAFRADAEKRNIELSPAPHDKIAAVVAEVLATPPAVAARVKALIEAK